MKHSITQTKPADMSDAEFIAAIDSQIFSVNPAPGDTIVVNGVAELEHPFYLGSDREMLKKQAI